VQEINRLLEGCQNLKEGNIKGLGQKMFDTHKGLSQYYDVSCKELDFLVDAVRDNPAVVGARMMGGGFGGCTINIVKEETVDYVISKLAVKYEAAMQLPLTSYIASVGNGTEIV
jgi:galactokinase